MRQLRIMAGVATETANGLRQGGWSNWLVVSILAIALTIFGGVLQVTMTLKDLVSAWGSQLEISAYLKDGFDPRAVAHEVSQLPDVKLVEIVPKDVAWQEMQSSFKVAALTNPLPNTLHIQLNSPESVEKAASVLKSLNSIEHVRYPLTVAKNLNRFRHFVEAFGCGVTAALTAATLMVIGNTVQLVIQSRHREIEIQSLMGVNPWYIKGPLVLQGALYGLASALLATLVIWGLDTYVDAYVANQLIGFLPMAHTESSFGMLPTFFVLLLSGMAVGAGGSAWTSGRFIKI